MNKLLFAIIALFLFGCDASFRSITHKGQSNYVIVVEAGTDSLTRRAAVELQKYIRNATDAELEITAEGGEPSIKLITQGDNPNEIGYRMENNNLVIHGGSPRALLNSVYTFLENELDVRFYAPETDVVPEWNEWVLDKSLAYRYTPPITTRTVHSRLFYENTAFADKLRVTHEAFPGYVPEARVHTFHRFLPAEEYLEEHPEFYALRDGKRLPTQLCLTNESVFEIVRDRVGELLESNPEANVISVSQDDNTQYCMCDACEAIHEAEGSPAGSMIYFVNRIAREFPDKEISTLAYQYTRKAPSSIRPEENVLITLCSIECDRSAAIDEKCLDFAQDLKDWSVITDNVRIWDYTTQFTNFLAPFPNLHTLKPNINLFMDSNAKWIFEQHSNNPSSLFELRSYLTAKLLWNPSFDADSIMNDFANGYYGQGGRYIVDYIHMIEDEMKKDPEFFLFLYGDPAQGFDSFLSDENLERYNELFDKAMAAVGPNQQLADRINMARIGVDYATLEYAKTKLGAMSVEEQADLRSRLNRFVATTERNNITMMNEMRFMVEDYLSMYDQTLERAIKPNFAVGKSVTLLTKPTKYANEDPAVLTDGAFGGAGFYANWLGFLENAEAVIDMGSSTEVHEINTAFLKVVNHVVFYPHWVDYYGSNDGEKFTKLGRVENMDPLTPESKINEIQYYTLAGLEGSSYRYIKLVAKNFEEAPVWHHAAGQPVWIFLDEVEIR